MKMDTLILGGGAAGFFTAVNLGKMSPDRRIVILEKSNQILAKVKVSGGGRCNVTHAEFIPSELVKNYPRGEKELLGPFHRFMTGDVITWFEDRGVVLKTENDGRMFPVTDCSQTILDCFLKEAQKYGVEVLKNQSVIDFYRENEQWKVLTKKGEFFCQNLVITTGSSPQIWKLLKKLSHTIIPPVPSLFTFNIKDPRITDLSGISKKVSVKVLDSKLESEGPLLVTHWGMSGPAILKLSAWGARKLFDLDYRFSIQINWLFDIDKERAITYLQKIKQENGKQLVSKYPHFELPKRLWQNLVKASEINSEVKWAEVTKNQLTEFASQITESIFKVEGKSTFKEEFVTAGGVDLKEIDFKTFGSKLHPGLYFAGEVLNIDAVTGGFNFQNAWTGGYIVARSIMGSPK